jgi:choline kinase
VLEIAAVSAMATFMLAEPVHSQDGDEAAVIVAGQVVVADENAAGVPIGVAIVDESAGDQSYYYVVSNVKGKELLKQVGAVVTVTGTVSKTEDGTTWINVSTWEPYRERRDEGYEEETSPEGEWE